MPCCEILNERREVGSGRVFRIAGVRIGRMRCRPALALGAPVERLVVHFLRCRSTSSWRRRLPLGGSTVLICARRPFINGKILVPRGRRAIATDMTGLATVVASSRECVGTFTVIVGIVGGGVDGKTALAPKLAGIALEARACCAGGHSDASN